MKFRMSLLFLLPSLTLPGVVAASNAGAAPANVAFRSLGAADEVTAVASLPDGTIRFAAACRVDH